MLEVDDELVCFGPEYTVYNGMD